MNDVCDQGAAFFDEITPARGRHETAAKRPSSTVRPSPASTKAYHSGEAGRAAERAIDQDADANREQRITYYADRASERLPLFSDLANAPFTRRGQP